jgi:hypothetical protein
VVVNEYKGGQRVFYRMRLSEYKKECERLRRQYQDSPDWLDRLSGEEARMLTEFNQELDSLEKEIGYTAEERAAALAESYFLPERINGWRAIPGPRRFPHVQEAISA